MKSYHGEQKDCQYFNHVTLSEFEEEYKKLAYSETKEVVASNLFPLKSSGGSNLRDDDDNTLYDAVIYFNVREKDYRQLNLQSGKVESTPKKPESDKEMIM